MQKRIVLVIIVLFAVVAAIFIWNGAANTDKDKDGVDEQPTMNDLSYTARKIASEGSFDEALEYYDKQAEKAEVSEDKITILIKKSRFALGEGKTAEAVKAAKQAYDSSESDRTMRALADAYAADGNKEQALIYYKKLLESSTPEEGDGGVTARGPSIQQIISELEK